MNVEFITEIFDYQDRYIGCWLIEYSAEFDEYMILKLIQAAGTDNSCQQGKNKGYIYM